MGESLSEYVCVGRTDLGEKEEECVEYLQLVSRAFIATFKGGEGEDTHTLGERGGDIINNGQQRRGTDGREGEGQYFRF